MARHPYTLALLLLTAPFASSAAVADAVPAHDHVIVVVMENKSYDAARVQPYTASLIPTGALFTNSFAVAHPSQPNYFALWGGATMVSNDNCPPAGSPYTFTSLGRECTLAGKTWRTYSENLGAVGSTACSFDGNTSTGLYTRKHCPWVSYSNITHTNERPYSDLAIDIAANQLPNLAFVIPNNCHNSHNSSTAGCGIADADFWLSQNLPAMITAAGPNGLVVLTWDEDDSSAGNHILTLFVGGLVAPGAVSTRTVTHYTVLRTICDALGLATVGSALGELPITDVWLAPTPAKHESWGALKIRYH
jgi:acid phosphatase